MLYEGEQCKIRLYNVEQKKENIEMAEQIKIGGPRLRDLLNLVQIIVGICVVVGSGSGYFLIQDHVKSHSERIAELEKWRADHSQIAAQRIQILDTLKERVDACCPLFDGRHK